MDLLPGRVISKSLLLSFKVEIDVKLAKMEGNFLQQKQI